VETNTVKTIETLKQELARIRDLFPWHRGDEGAPDVPVLQPRYDALRQRVVELETELSNKEDALIMAANAADRRGSKLKAAEDKITELEHGANLLEQKLVDVQKELSLVKEATSFDYREELSDWVRND